MDKEYKIKIGKIIFQAAKIAVGSCGAISIAMALNLEYATTAGIITLLSIVPTKWDTLKLSLYIPHIFHKTSLLRIIIMKQIQHRCKSNPDQYKKKFIENKFQTEIVCHQKMSSRYCIDRDRRFQSRPF